MIHSVQTQLLLPGTGALPCLLAGPAILALAAVAVGRAQRRKTAEMDTLRRISSMVNRSSDLQTVLGAALEELLAQLEMQVGLIRIWSDSEAFPSLVITRGLTMEAAAPAAGEGGGGTVLLSSGANGLRTWNISLPGSPDGLVQSLQKCGMRFVAVYPILSGNQVIGSLALASRESKRSTQLREGFVQALAEILGTACAHARLQDHAAKLQENLVTLQGINKIISQSFELDDIIGRIVAEGKRLFKSGECHLFLLDQRRQRLVGSATTQPGTLNVSAIEWDLSSPVLPVRALNERRVITMLSTGDLEIPEAGLRDITWKSALCAPLAAKDESIGVLLFTNDSRSQAYAPEEIGRAESLAHQASIALENARLFHIVSRSQKEWETTFDAMQDSVSLHDSEGRVLRANRALARRMNTTPARIIGRSCSDLYVPDNPVAHGCSHLRTLETQEVIVEEVELPHMGGAYQLSVSPWYDKNLRLVGSIHVAKDISRERLLQQQLVQSEKLSAIGELISGIAHELNNPLTGVMGFSQLLQLRKDLDDRAKESLLKINNLALRCKRIVDNLLSFARRQKPERKLCDINEMLERTIDLRSYEFQVNNIELECSLAPQLPKTIADGHQLQQVFLNIITNAEQAMLGTHGRGRLKIATRQDFPENHVVIEIADDGPGIPETHLTKIFDPFFTTKEVGKGTGLGLSLSYGIIKEHGGNIYARSRAGEGATFVVELPVITSIPNEKELIPSLLPQTVQFENLVRGKRILVVDDEKYILDFFSEVLRLYPLEVDTADDGTLAMNMLIENQYDVIITDYKMPNMNGRELFNWVREKRPQLLDRIIFVTGDTVSDETRTFFERAGNRYLAKPFKIDEVREFIRATLEGTQARESS